MSKIDLEDNGHATMYWYNGGDRWRSGPCQIRIDAHNLGKNKRHTDAAACELTAWCKLHLSVQMQRFGFFSRLLPTRAVPLRHFQPHLHRRRRRRRVRGTSFFTTSTFTFTSTSTSTFSSTTTIIT